MSLPLVRLMTMLSPAFPVGAYSFSSGLEQAASDKLVTDHAWLQAWLNDILTHGALWNDAVLLAESWRGTISGAGVGDLNELAVALAGSPGRLEESRAQGRAFVDAASHAWPVPELGEHPAYCVAVGAVAAHAGIALSDVLAAFLNAALSNQVQAAIRLSVTGQQGGVAVLAALEPVLVSVARMAGNSTLDDLGTAALVAEIAAMNHETLPSRIFRT
ncbi:MAG: urease accessory UreF family protein [Pseudomonadota bacterium]|nr:urease accessory UreF family protein [Pseudomonadota bacterium]